MAGDLTAADGGGEGGPDLADDRRMIIADARPSQDFNPADRPLDDPTHLAESAPCSVRRLAMCGSIPNEPSQARESSLS